MRASTYEPTAAHPLNFEQLLLRFETHDSKLDTLCRRIGCVGPSFDSEQRIKRLEYQVDRELDAIVRVALALSCMPAKDPTHVRMKAHVIWNFIGDEEPESISDILIRSLCRDILDASNRS